jgi:hypothetical protein
MENFLKEGICLLTGKSCEKYSYCGFKREYLKADNRIRYLSRGFNEWRTPIQRELVMVNSLKRIDRREKNGREKRTN